MFSAESIPLHAVAINTDEGVNHHADVVRTLIARAKAGDLRAFDDLMIRYQRQVANTARGLLCNSADAADATQEVFLRLYKYLGSFRESEQLEPWLYRVTVNVCRDLGRKRSRKQEVSFEQQRESGALLELPSHQDVEREVAAAEERDIINAGLGTLTERERSALVLRDVEGLDTNEVARILGSTSGTVRSQVCLARMKLKKYRDRVLGREPRRLK